MTGSTITVGYNGGAWALTLPAAAKMAAGFREAARIAQDRAGERAAFSLGIEVGGSPYVLRSTVKDARTQADEIDAAIERKRREGHPTRAVQEVERDDKGEITRVKTTYQW